VLIPVRWLRSGAEPAGRRWRGTGALGHASHAVFLTYPERAAAPAPGSSPAAWTAI